MSGWYVDPWSSYECAGDPYDFDMNYAVSSYGMIYYCSVSNHLYWYNSEESQWQYAFMSGYCNPEVYTSDFWMQEDMETFDMSYAYQDNGYTYYCYSDWLYYYQDNTWQWNPFECCC